jgi:hypothetical protein
LRSDFVDNFEQIFLFERQHSLMEFLWYEFLKSNIPGSSLRSRGPPARRALLFRARQKELMTGRLRAGALVSDKS